MYQMNRPEDIHRYHIKLPASRLISLFVGGLLLISMNYSWADKDKSGKNTPLQKIHVSADHMQLNIETGYSVYTGNVKISQGELVLTGDKVTLKSDKEEVERMTVTGKPARYNHVTDKGETIEAESESMVYTASEHTLVMRGNAKLQQTDHKVSSQLITYDTLKKIVIAGTKDSTDSSGTGSTGDKKDDSRVNITLTPKKKAAEDATNKR